jgi:hypothetical protein
MASSRIVFKRIGGVMATQTEPAILLQIERRQNDVRRLLLSTPTRHYCEHFLPTEDYDTQWISLVRGINESLLMNQRTINIQMDNEEIVNAILTGQIPTDSVNTKYHHLMFMDSIRKTDWCGIRSFCGEIK